MLCQSKTQSLCMSASWSMVYERATKSLYHYIILLRLTLLARATFDLPYRIEVRTSIHSLHLHCCRFSVYGLARLRSIRNTKPTTINISRKYFHTSPNLISQDHQHGFRYFYYLDSLSEEVRQIIYEFALAAEMEFTGSSFLTALKGHPFYDGALEVHKRISATVTLGNEAEFIKLSYARRSLIRSLKIIFHCHP
jgi:hypothetical protein